MPSRRALAEKDSNTAKVPITPPAAKRRGPAPTPIKDRKYTPRSGPIKRRQHHYTHDTKVNVLMFLEHHRVRKLDEESICPPRLRQGETELPGIYRRPTYQEAADWFKVPRSTVISWYQNRESIVNRSSNYAYHPQWPELETALYGAFRQRRSEGKLVSTSWFKRTAKRIFAQQNPNSKHLFIFSPGWFRGFQNRMRITRRRLTKQATKLPTEYFKVVNSFLSFIRRVNQMALAKVKRSNVGDLLGSPARRFPNSRILNLDETPVPFEYLDGYTYDDVGAKTVAGKSDRSGWGKRQATLILYIFADGIQRIKPKIIFHGKPAEEGGQLWKKEGLLYAEGVTVEFNKTAYNNEYLFKRWIEEELVALTKGDEYLLVMDVASFHKTDSILALLRQHHITPCLIPPGTTSLLQPLDTAVNKPFKQWLSEATDAYVLDEEEKALNKQEELKWETGMKRIMVTKTVETAAAKLAHEKGSMVSQAFLQCGISIRPDGSQVDEIRIKDVPAEAIDYTGWELFDVEAHIEQETLQEEIPDFAVLNDGLEYIFTAEEVRDGINGQFVDPTVQPPYE